MEFLRQLSDVFVGSIPIIMGIAGSIGLVWGWILYRRSHIKLDFAGKTDKGGREENQDFSGVRTKNRKFSTDLSTEWYFHGKSGNFCFVVADGLGGHQGGQTAAALAVHTILDHFEQFPVKVKDNIEQELENALMHAHHIIQEHAKSDRVLEGMKATCVVLLILKNRAYWSHIGDSRLYLLREGEIQHKTRDHSVVQVLLDMEEITEDEVRGHPDRNRVLKTLGMNDELKPEVVSEILESGDYIVLCTDGFWEYFTDNALEKALRHSSQPVEKELEQLFHRACTEAQKNDEKYDNLTLQLLRVR